MQHYAFNIFFYKWFNVYFEMLVCNERLSFLLPEYLITF